MKEIIYRGAINALSFGNISYNLLREMYRKDMKVAFFPFGDKLAFDSFDKIEEDFKNWIISSAQNRFKDVDLDTPSLSQWHLNGSESNIGSRPNLFTFHETDQVTEIEKSIGLLHENLILSSSHSLSKFKEAGLDNCHHVSIGFDEDFNPTNETYMEGKIHFGLMGKFEKRKNTGQILQAWAKKYGNNFKYQLSCCITNPFFKIDDMNKIIAQALGNKVYGNINFLPHLKTNSEVNEFMNAIDIDLTGLSGAEGWNLPSFNSTALGKWSIVMNHTSHKDWANEKNCILVEPEFTSEIYDNTFFHKGQAFNQGNMNGISEDNMISLFEKSENFYQKPNKEGVKLKSKFTYSKTLNKLLKIIKL